MDKLIKDITNTKISLFIPVYNESKRIYKNISSLMNYLNVLKPRFDVFIVNDNSKDNTIEIIKKLSKKFKNIKIIDYKNGPSRRENLADAFKQAKTEIVIFMDSDMATDFGALPNLINKLTQYKIAIGSRYLKNSKIDRKIYRILISFIYNNTIRFVFKSKVRDHQCGFKGFHRETGLKLIKEMGYDKKFKRGWFWDAEFLIRAQNHHIKIIEVPVVWTYGEKSSFSLRRELKMIKYVINLKKRLK